MLSGGDYSDVTPLVPDGHFLEFLYQAVGRNLFGALRYFQADFLEIFWQLAVKGLLCADCPMTGQRPF